jgi:hypothetical protein
MGCLKLTYNEEIYNPLRVVRNGAEELEKAAQGWLFPDPMGQHFSPYLGMSNNPVSFIDPTGGRDRTHEEETAFRELRARHESSIEMSWARQAIDNFNTPWEAMNPEQRSQYQNMVGTSYAASDAERILTVASLGGYSDKNGKTLGMHNGTLGYWEETTNEYAAPGKEGGLAITRKVTNREWVSADGFNNGFMTNAVKSWIVREGYIANVSNLKGISDIKGRELRDMYIARTRANTPQPMISWARDMKADGKTARPGARFWVTNSTVNNSMRGLGVGSTVGLTVSTAPRLYGAYQQGGTYGAIDEGNVIMGGIMGASAAMQLVAPYAVATANPWTASAMFIGAGIVGGIAGEKTVRGMINFLK